MAGEPTGKELRDAEMDVYGHVVFGGFCLGGWKANSWLAELGMRQLAGTDRRRSMGV